MLVKNAEIKYKRLIPKQKELINLLNDLLDTIKTLGSKSQKDENDETLRSSSEDDENDETLMSSNEDDDDDDDETMNQNKKNEIIKLSNDTLDKIIDKLKSKLFEEQIKLLKKIENLDQYFQSSSDKELKFKLKLAYLSNIILDKKFFEQIFGHILETLANKVINAKKKTKKKIK